MLKKKVSSSSCKRRFYYQCYLHRNNTAFTPSLPPTLNAHTRTHMSSHTHTLKHSHTHTHTLTFVSKNISIHQKSDTFSPDRTQCPKEIMSKRIFQVTHRGGQNSRTSVGCVFLFKTYCVWWFIFKMRSYGRFLYWIISTWFVKSPFRKLYYKERWTYCFF